MLYSQGIMHDKQSLIGKVGPRARIRFFDKFSLWVGCAIVAGLIALLLAIYR